MLLGQKKTINTINKIHLCSFFNLVKRKYVSNLCINPKLRLISLHPLIKMLQYLTIIYSKMSKPKIIEKEKLVAEQLNGRFAMLGFIAAVGAYLTTGQIIPGFV